MYGHMAHFEVSFNELDNMNILDCIVAEETTLLIKVEGGLVVHPDVCLRFVKGYLEIDNKASIWGDGKNPDYAIEHMGKIEPKKISRLPLRFIKYDKGIFTGCLEIYSNK